MFCYFFNKTILRPFREKLRDFGSLVNWALMQTQGSAMSDLPGRCVYFVSRIIHWKFLYSPCSQLDDDRKMRAGVAAHSAELLHASISHVWRIVQQPVQYYKRKCLEAVFTPATARLSRRQASAAKSGIKQPAASEREKREHDSVRELDRKRR